MGTVNVNLPSIEYEINSSGFSIVPDVVDDRFCGRLKEELLQALDKDWESYGKLPGKSRDLANNLVIYGGAFLTLLDNETMHEVFGRFLGHSCILYNYGSTIMPPHSGTAASKIHVDTPRIVPGYHAGLIMTLALDDFTHDNGGTYYLPGSHLLPEPPDEQLFETRKVSVSRSRGAAVFFNPRTFHRGGFNSTPHLRAGITVYAVRSFMKQRFDFTKMVPEGAADLLTERSRGFLGFNSRIPARMEDYYVSAENRLYKAGQE